MGLEGRDLYSESPEHEAVELFTRPRRSVTPWSGVILEKLIFTQKVKKFDVVYVNGRPVFVFTRSCQQSEEINLVHAMSPCFLNIPLNSILPTTPRSSKWPLRFFHKTFAIIPFLPTHVTRPVHFTIFNFIILMLTNKYYTYCKIVIPSLSHFHQSPVTSSLTGPIILPSAMFSKPLSVVLP